MVRKLALGQRLLAGEHSSNTIGKSSYVRCIRDACNLSRCVQVTIIFFFNGVGPFIRFVTTPTEFLVARIV